MTKPTEPTTEANASAPTETIHTCPRCGATVTLTIPATAWHLPCGRRMTQRPFGTLSRGATDVLMQTDHVR